MAPKPRLPSWLSEVRLRKVKLVELVMAGVSRPMLRQVTGWSNNQTASFTYRAGISFDRYPTVGLLEMKVPLLKAGFDADLIDRAIRALQVTNALHPQTFFTQSVPLPAKTEEPGSPENPDSPDDTTTTVSPQDNSVIVPPITEAEVTAAFRRDMVEESHRQGATEDKKKIPAKTPKEVSVKRDSIPAIKGQGCQYPIGNGPGLKQVIYCGGHVVYAKCCHDHATMLYESYRRSQKKTA